MGVLKKPTTVFRRRGTGSACTSVSAACRLILVLMLTACLPAGAADGQSIGEAIRLSDRVTMAEAYQGVRLRGGLRLRAVPGLTELSALAWDEDESLLYALSDNGRLLHLQPVLQDGQLVDVLLQQVLVLRGPQGKPLAGHHRDSEGLALENSNNGVAGDSLLLISFERHNRIDRYTADGNWLERLKLPPLLRQSGFYRSFNEGLETVTLHPRYGVLTAPERSRDDRPIPIIGLQGKTWLYQPFEENGALVALETLPDGDIIVLERAFTSPITPWVITLSRVRLTTANEGEVLDAQRLVRFDSSEGWRTLNFEGLAAHRDGRLFMVSDDGGRLWQSTQILYLEILSAPPG